MRSIPYLIKALLVSFRSNGAKAALARTAQYLIIALRRRRFTYLVPVTAVKQPKWTRADPILKDAPPTAKGRIISLLMPVYDTDPLVLNDAIYSVLTQSYSSWELCICDDASTRVATRELLESFRGFDPRLKITRSEVNEGISAATNRAAEFSTGEFIGFLDHDDVLTQDALEIMANAISLEPEADVLYSDEDKLEPNGHLSEPYLKPDWSPEHLLSVPYILHFMVLRKSLFLKLGGLRSTFDGAQDYDLSLRATKIARKVVHVPKILYHWRKVAGSAAAQIDAKPIALVNGFRAVTEFVQLQAPNAAVSKGLFPGSFRVQWPVSKDQPVTLLILTNSGSRVLPGQGEVLLVKNAIESIYRLSTFRNFSLLVLDNGAMTAEVRGYIEGLGALIETYKQDGEFNYSEKLNTGVNLVETDDLIILNDDVEVISPDWIEALLSYSRLEGVGCVGGRLLYPDHRIQHAGIVLGLNRAGSHIFHNQPAHEVGYCGYTHIIRNYSAVTGAVMATRKSLIEKLGGFDTVLAVDFNDVDFCLRLAELGFRTVYTPHATLYHFEGSSLQRSEPRSTDLAHFLSKWPALNADPYYNKGLPKDRLDCGLSSW